MDGYLVAHKPQQGSSAPIMTREDSVPDLEKYEKINETNSDHKSINFLY